LKNLKTKAVPNHENVCLDDSTENISDKNKDHNKNVDIQNNYSIKLSDVRQQIEKENYRSVEKDKMVSKENKDILMSKENKDENFSVPQAKCISPGIMEEIGSDRERLTEDLTSSSRKDSSESNSCLTTNHKDILANCKINKP
jgi:hypothetical protein